MKEIEMGNYAELIEIAGNKENLKVLAEALNEVEKVAEVQRQKIRWAASKEKQEFLANLGMGEYLEAMRSLPKEILEREQAIIGLEADLKHAKAELRIAEMNVVLTSEQLSNAKSASEREAENKRTLERQLLQDEACVELRTHIIDCERKYATALADKADSERRFNAAHWITSVRSAQLRFITS